MFVYDLQTNALQSIPRSQSAFITARYVSLVSLGQKALQLHDEREQEQQG